MYFVFIYVDVFNLFCFILIFHFGARRYEANHRGIEGEHRTECARVRR